MPEAAAATPTPTPSTGTTAAPPPPGDTGATPAEAAAPGSIPSAKPIKSYVPQLPGVLPDPEPQGDDHPSRASSPPARDASGRFVSTTPAGVGEHSGQDADPAPEPVEGDEAFFVAGEKFKNRAEFEQHFKSLRGNFKPLQSLAKTLGGMEKIMPAIQQAADSARAWKADSESKDQRIAALEAEIAGRSGKTATPASEGAGDQSDPGIDWDLYAEIKRVATERGEPWKAEQWLIKKTEERAESRFQRMLDAKLEPVESERKQSEMAAQTSELFASLGEAKNADGSIAYPELHDENAAFAVGRLWANLGLPPEAALTPQGAVAAIAVYRMARAGVSQAAVPPESAPNPTGELPPASPTDAESAASLGDGRPSPVARTDSAISPEAAHILSGLRKVNSDSKRALLGFAE